MPYVLAHPGTTTKELARLFGTTEAQVVKDLDLLFVTGVPPYDPGSLIDVQVDEDGGVYISSAEVFSRPLRLTRTEAVALYLRGKAVLGTPGLDEAPALASALKRLEEAIGAELQTIAPAVEADGETEPPKHLRDLREAIATCERVEIRYYSASRNEVRTRAIEPEDLFSAVGRWYLTAWDVEAEGERTFRVDRIHSLRRTNLHFSPRHLSGNPRELYPSDGEGFVVDLDVPETSAWVADHYGADLEPAGPGRLRIRFSTGSLAWVPRLVLRLGPGARVLGPPSLRELVVAEARAALAPYGDEATDLR